ncbi:hypothetical protein BgiBS90_000570 [Biomphalaria glabrata]|nr:hypothetical protein BgiBS90_000570 [Biomphalaria glabrata]
MAIKDCREVLNVKTDKDDDDTVKSNTSTDNINPTLEWVTPRLKPRSKAIWLRLFRSLKLRNIQDQKKHGLSLKPKMANGNPN